MSKIKLNYEEYKEVQKSVEESKTYVEKAIDLWEENFNQLHNNFINNNFLDELYETPKNKIKSLFVNDQTICGIRDNEYLKNAGTLASNSVTTTNLSSLLSLDRWIIDEIITPLTSSVGIGNVVNDYHAIDFRHEAKNNFEKLLNECNGKTGTITQANYKEIKNLDEKLENVKLSLQKVLTKIEEYNEKYADLRESASKEGIILKHSNSDNMTVLGIETSITLDGNEIKTTTSEALGSFYTYTNTTMNNEIATDYLRRTYGYDINYSDIVKNANTFTTNTLQSGLYSHEFIKGILPEFNPQNANIYKTIGASTSVDLNKLESVFNNNAALAGSVALFGGLLGSAFVGSVGVSNKTNAISEAVSDELNLKNKENSNETKID